LARTTPDPSGETSTRDLTRYHVPGAHPNGAAALMLSGETAIGAHGVQAVETMRRVADAVWEHFQASRDGAGPPDASGIPGTMGEAIALLCRRLPVTKIVAVTISGFAARMVAAQRPRQPILAVSNNAANARAFRLLPGTVGVHVDLPFSRTSMDHVPRCLQELWRRRLLVDADLVLITAVSYPRSGNRMNLIEMHRVADLRKALGWQR